VTRRPFTLVLLVSACDGSADSDQAHVAAAETAPEAEQANESMVNVVEPVAYSRPTDSATAHCYEPRSSERDASTERFVGCWERFLAGGERLSLSVTDRGYFVASLDGGDYDGSDFGRWEQSDTGLVLFPGNGACALVGGVFDDACVRLFDVDDDGVAIHSTQQFAYDELTEFEWMRGTDCPAVGDDPEFLAPEDVRCFPDAIEPLEVGAVKIDMNPADGTLSMAFLEFTLSPDLLHADERDIQRNLVASVSGFTLRLPDGSLATQFSRHARRDPIDLGQYPRERGDFHIQSNPNRDLVTVTFLHDVRDLPAQLELHYEFRDAKYIKDTGARVQRLSTRQ